MKKELILQELEILKQNNNYRILKTNDKKKINLSSNDYLGIAHNEELKNRFINDNIHKILLSSSSSRLIDGSYEDVIQLEKRVEEIYKKPCIVFNSGFDANSSVIETFFNKNSLIITDKLNHSSIYDGIVNSQATFFRYRHLDYLHLEELLKKHRDKYEDVIIISETVYSMDGDVADLKKLVQLKKQYNCQLMIDEAHSYGVCGYGMAYLSDTVKDIDFLVIPLGKGGASVGAYVICESYLKEYIINKSKKFIYSTALPPINNQWNLFILENMKKFEEKQKKLEEIVKYTHKKLKDMGITTQSSTHIISIIVGDNKKVIDISKNMLDKGIVIHPIKEPTVPKNTARFRIGLHSNLTNDEIDYFLKELKDELDSVF